jgi:glycosyltransferase involved in cell wall biosynthesis
MQSLLYKLLGLNPEQNLMGQIAQLKAKLGIYSEVSWIDKLIGIYAEIACYPDPMKAWADNNTAQRDFDKCHPDLVMSYSFPHSSHLVAAKLKRNNVPWVAYFSDLWTESHFYPYSRWRKRREQEFEAHTLKDAKCFITVSKELAETLENHHPQHTYVIHNGYPKMPQVPLTSDYTLTYVGNFYPKAFDLYEFCWWLSACRIKFPELKVRFFGQPYPYLQQLVRKENLEDMVKFYGPTTHAEGLKAMVESHVLLMFPWNDAKGILQSKLFDYLGAKRPIIAFGGTDESVGKVLEETKAGQWLRTPSALAAVLSTRPKYQGWDVNKYSYENMARKHAELFDRMVGE